MKQKTAKEEEEGWTPGGGGADLSEMKEAMAAVGLSSMKLRRALRAELGRKQGR